MKEREICLIMVLLRHPLPKSKSLTTHIYCGKLSKDKYDYLFTCGVSGKKDRYTYFVQGRGRAVAQVGYCG